MKKAKKKFKKNEWKQKKKKRIKKNEAILKVETTQ